MQSKISRFSLYYILASLSNSLLSFILLPVLTHFIEPAVLGVWVVLQTTAIYYQLLSTLGMNSLLMEKGFENQRYGLFIKTCKFNTALHIILIGLVILFSRHFLSFLLGPETSATCFLPLLLIVGGAALERLVLPVVTLFQVYERILVINIFKCVYALLFFVFAIIGAMQDNPVFYLCLGFFAANLIWALLVILYFLHTPFVLFFKKARPCTIPIKRIISFAFPIYLGLIFLEAMHSIDRFMIQVMSNSSMVAAYSVIYKGGIFYLLIINSFREAWYPYILKKTRENIADTASRFFLMFLSINLVFLIITCTLVPRIYAFEFRDFLLIPVFYHRHFWNFPVLLMAYFFCGLYYFLEVLTLREGHVWPHTFLKCLCMAVNIILNILWIPAWGLAGAFYSTCISFALIFLISLLWTKQIHQALIKNTRYFIIILLLCLVFFMLFKLGLFKVT
jgi:O-antigen/teichoic acid export membrane protein